MYMYVHTYKPQTKKNAIYVRNSNSTGKFFPKKKNA